MLVRARYAAYLINCQDYKVSKDEVGAVTHSSQREGGAVSRL
jgi:hypothetical protein